MAERNGKITQKDLYGALLDIRAKMDSHRDEIMGKLERDRERRDGQIKDLDDRIDKIEKDIIVGDRRWGLFNSILAAIAAFLGVQR